MVKHMSSTQAQILVLPLNIYITLGKLFNLSVP